MEFTVYRAFPWERTREGTSVKYGDGRRVSWQKLEKDFGERPTSFTSANSGKNTVTIRIDELECISGIVETKGKVTKTIDENRKHGIEQAVFVLTEKGSALLIRYGEYRFAFVAD